jgi:MFS family permease
MVTTFFVSYAYELIGRKVTIFTSFLLTSIVFYLIPYTAPNYNYLIAARCAIGVTMSAPIASPLIPDYIKRSSRGKAVALNGIGLVFGEVMSMGVLFNLTKTMSYYAAFSITASLIFCFSLYFLIAVKDPILITMRTGKTSRHSLLALERRNRNSVLEPSEMA